VCLIESSLTNTVTDVLFQVVGKWFNSLELNLDHLVWNNNQTVPPTSACSLPCDPGMIKKQQVSRIFDINRFQTRADKFGKFFFSVIGIADWGIA
jgi:hypothetical protein